MNIRRIMFRLGKAAGYLAFWFFVGWQCGRAEAHAYWANSKGRW